MTEDKPKSNPSEPSPSPVPLTRFPDTDIGDGAAIRPVDERPEPPPPSPKPDDSDDSSD